MTHIGPLVPEVSPRRRLMGWQSREAAQSAGLVLLSDQELGAMFIA